MLFPRARDERLADFFFDDDARCSFDIFLMMDVSFCSSNFFTKTDSALRFSMNAVRFCNATEASRFAFDGRRTVSLLPLPSIPLGALRTHFNLSDSEAYMQRALPKPTARRDVSVEKDSDDVGKPL